MARDNKRKADVFYHDRLAGILEETDAGYKFTYDPGCLKTGKAISLSLPLQAGLLVSHTFSILCWAEFRRMVPGHRVRDEEDRSHG